MAVTESRDVVIEATPEQVMDVLLDLESVPKWSPVHQKVEILERDDQGRATKSRQVVKVVGIADEQVLAYSIHDDGVSWTLINAKLQRAQNARYTLSRDGDATRVHVELTIDLAVPVPGFLIKKGAKGLMETATEGLRKRVLQVHKGG
jgi:ribosome-associated toxin RatA of RatAB toxin-antitoxin module